MAFKLSGSLSPYGGPILRSSIIGNSVVTSELHSVKVSSGFVALGTAAALVYGHVKALQTNEGVGLNTTGAAGAAMGSFVGTWTAASDNQTVGKVRAVVDISKETLYSVSPDAAIGTTTGSNLLGYYTNLADKANTGESSALTTILQYFIHGVDPLNSANQIVNVAQSLVFGA